MKYRSNTYWEVYKPIACLFFLCVLTSGPLEAEDEQKQLVLLGQVDSTKASKVKPMAPVSIPKIPKIEPTKPVSISEDSKISKPTQREREPALRQTSRQEGLVSTEDEIPPEVFSFRGVEDLTSPVKIELKGNEVDLSSVIQSLERVKESHYDNVWTIRISLSNVYDKIRDLCRKSGNEDTCIENGAQTLNNFESDIQKEMSDRILYPVGYGADSSYVKKDFEKAVTLLDSECSVKNCSHPGLLYSIMDGSRGQYSQLYDKIRNEDKNCQKLIARGLAKRFKAKRFPEECLKKENKSHPVCKNMLRDIRIARDRFLEIVELAYREENLRTTEAQAICVECISEPGSEMLKAMRDLIKVLDQYDQCLELNPGEEKVVYPGTGLSQFGPYNVRRESDGSYSVPLNLDFYPGEDYDDEELVSREEVPSHYMRKVQKCMGKVLIHR